MLETTFAPQKVLHLADALAKKNVQIAGNYIVTEKMDGWWTTVRYRKGAGWGVPCSATGREIPSLIWMQEHLNKTLQCNLEEAAIIAEVRDCDYSIPFHITNGYLNRKEEQYLAAKLFIHDILFKVNGLILSAGERMNALLGIQHTDAFEVLKPLAITDKLAHWEALAEAVWDSGGEGIVMKAADGFYYPGKRNATLLKLKMQLELDLLCVGTTNSVGKKGEPALNLQLKDSLGNRIEVVVPKDSDRDAFTADQTLVVGQVCTIRAMKRLPNGSLREPRFRHIRTDKFPHEIN
jgi:hypothetical protein